MIPRANRRVHAGVAGLVVLFTLIVQPPWRVGMPSSSLDQSWAMAIQYAFSKGWQFGSDVVFTYGPLGFIMVPQYAEGLFVPALLYWIAFYTALILALCFLYRRANAIFLLALAAATLVLAFNWAHDGPYFAACFIVFLLTRKEERRAAVLAAALTVLLAAAALMKTTALMLALPTVILSDLFRRTRPDAIPILTATFVASYIGFYLIAGQSLGALPTYLVNALEVSRGYGEAMHVYGSLVELALFVLAAGTLLTVIAVREYPQSRVSAFYLLAMTAGFLFVTAKAGFVRHDTGHVMIPWVALMLAATAYLGELSSGGRHILGGGLAAAIFACAGMTCVTYVAGAREAGRTEPAAQVLRGDLRDQVLHDAVAVANLIFGDQMAQYRAAHTAQMKAMRAQTPLPPLGETVDVLGVNQGVGIASAAAYRPRPIFQSYSVYTPRLIELNRAALTGPNAAETILFEIDTVDGRFPSLDEGALWPDLLRHYDVTHFESGYAVLRRRASSRPVELQDLHQASVAFGETLDVSEWAAGGLLWVEIDISASLLGKVRSALFKPPLLMMSVTTDAGNTQTFRIVPGMTGSGFLLSPLIETADQFALLPAREESAARFSISAIGRPAGMFEGNIGVRLKRLHIAGEREAPEHLDMDALAELRTLRALAASAGGIAGQKKAQVLPDGKALAHAPSQLALPVPQGATTLEFSYGILDGAWAGGDETDGACFRVTTREHILHDACLDPKGNPEDRAPRTVNVAVPAGAARVTFETLPRGGTDKDWTYWSAVAFR